MLKLNYAYKNKVTNQNTMSHCTTCDWYSAHYCWFLNQYFLHKIGPRSMQYSRDYLKGMQLCIELTRQENFNLQCFFVNLLFLFLHLGPNAITVSISPLSGFVMVGLASRKLHLHMSSKQVLYTSLKVFTELFAFMNWKKKGKKGRIIA